MKIKRYQARDMRSALQQIRLEQGPDAVILSTQTIEGGVEVCAADDAGGRGLRSARTSELKDLNPPATAPSPAVAAPAILQAAAAVAATPVTNIAGTDQAAMSAELRSLRELLERQLLALSWNDFTRRDPVRARALHELTALGMPRDEAWELVQQVPGESLTDAAATGHYDRLAESLAITDLDPLLRGPLALIGPQGAGKSTLLAKLAVRAVVEHGAAQVAIATLDTQRLGAGEQARSIGRLLGVDTAAPANGAELALQLQHWQGRRLVLIDTAGVQSRDAGALGELERQLHGASIRSLLVLPASAQDEVLRRCLERFAIFNPAAVVLTRLDEALRLGGCLAALLQARIPLAAVTDGPRVPEDLRPARSHELVALARALLAELAPPAGVEHAAA